MHALCMLDSSRYRHSGYLILIAFPPTRMVTRTRFTVMLYIHYLWLFRSRANARRIPFSWLIKWLCRHEQVRLSFFLQCPISAVLFSGTYSYGCWKQALTTRVGLLDIHHSLGLQFRPISLQLKVLHIRKCTGVIEPGWVLTVRWYTLCTVLLPVATG
jgi:hypothetical protein